MFTGLVESLGRIVAVTAAPAGMRVRVSADIASDAVPGESVSVNGVCLTVVEAGSQGLLFDVVAGDHPSHDPRFARRRYAGQSRAVAQGRRPRRRTLRAGHVDATGSIAAVRQEGESYRLTVAVPAALMPLIVPKGSIAVDGVSLTVASVDDDGGRFDVQIIPFTWQHTRFSAARPGDAVNVECDILGKYVVRALERRGARVGHE